MVHARLKRLRAVAPATRSRASCAGLALLFVALLVMAPPASAQDLVERTFEDETWSDGMVDLRSLDLSRTDLVNHAYIGGGLNVTIPLGGFRGLGPLDRLDPAPMEVWYRYYVRLTNWNAASTGKLPGLAGLYSSSGRGCIRPTATAPGWSARGMFGVPGTQGASPGRVPIGSYLYHEDQAGDCGDELWWSGPGLQQGRWHCIEGYVKMNSPGANNGIVRGWIDGDERFRKTNVEFRRAGESHIGIRHMWHNVYFGGSWPTPNSLSLVYDEVAVSDSGPPGCLAPFTDFGGTLHVTALTELHARGLLNGCGYRLACPFRELNRGEAAALFSRILALPPSTTDYFTDDRGHLFEGANNRLAQAGLTVGCFPGRYCPDRTLTRAEFATMVVRALGLTGPAPNAFSDDNGHWAENAINIFARANITEGCGSNRFCPQRVLTRDEAATFFLRVLNNYGTLDLAEVEPPPDFPPPGEPPPIPPEERD